MNDLRWDWAPPVEPTYVSDLDIYAEAADIMGRSLACLIGAMESGETILWCEEKSNVKT